MSTVIYRILRRSFYLRKVDELTKLSFPNVYNKPEPISCGCYRKNLGYNLYSTQKRANLTHNASQAILNDESEDITKEIQEIKAKEENILVVSPRPNSAVTEIVRSLPPTFNLAAYVNVSTTLQNLIKLGVDLHKIETKTEVAEMIAKLDFEKDVKPYIQFLCDNGVTSESLGKLFTVNPLIFKEDIEDLQVRVNYLQSKKFTKEMIARILESNPHWLMFPVEKIDSRLGFFQVTFKLSGNQVRQLATTAPKLITTKLAHVRLIQFVVKEEMGYDDHQMKTLLLRKPKIFRLSQASLLSRFEYVHKDMQIPHLQILEQPGILTYRVFKIQQRHLFLQSLGRAQYNPNLPGYISLDDLVMGTDSEFCENVAKSSVHSFNMFLKTL